MSAPVLNRRLVLEEAQRVADGAGGYGTVWAGLGVLWGEIRPGGGGEREGEGVTLSRSSYRIVVRAAPPGAPSRPRPGQRLREGARVFRIVAVTELDRRARHLVCHAEEEVVA